MRETVQQLGQLNVTAGHLRIHNMYLQVGIFSHSTCTNNWFVKYVIHFEKPSNIGNFQMASWQTVVLIKTE
jgi:hypothetical protein